MGMLWKEGKIEGINLVYHNAMFVVEVILLNMP
jgi:hypothetical protein